MENSISIWSASAGSKLKAWRQLRSTVSTQDLDTALDTATSWWRVTPAVRRTLDPWKIESWPNPWNLIYQNEQCPNSAVLGIYYTIVLSHLNVTRLNLAIVNDDEYKHNCLALIVDNDTAILYNKTVNLKSENLLEVLNTFTANDLIGLL